MFGFALIAVLAITGGVIAYIGDKLGTKVGKKKLTIFGLRPKHTSILVTIITGILITVSTIGILALVSIDVRTALFGMEELKTQLSTLSKEVLAQNNELDRSRIAIADSQKALEAKTAEYGALTLKIQDTTAKLAAISSELSAAIAERDQAALALEQTRGDLSVTQQSLQTLQRTKEELDLRVNALTEAKTGLQTDVASLKELTGRLRQGIQVVREGSIIYRAGEVLATIVLPGGTSQSEAERTLSEVIYRTNQSIIDKLDIEDKNLEILWVAQSDADKAVAELIKNPQDVILRISAGSNTVYGEHVIGHLNMFPNQLIYKQDQTIQMAIIDVGQKSDQAEEAVMLFLRKVNATAIKEGMLPDPIQGTVGAMNGVEFYDAVNAVKRYNGKVTFTATAKQDTYAAGPLKIEIHVQGSL